MARGKKKHIGITAIVMAIAALALLIAVLTYYLPVNIGGDVVTIIVKPGETFESIAKQLVANGVLSSKFLLKVPAVIYGIDKKLIPGRYDFTGRNSCYSVLKKLRRGDFVRIKITIPEGSSIWETARILADSLELDADYIASLNNDTALLSSLELPCLEGYLYPETYYFPWGYNAEETIKDMVIQFHDMTDSIWPDTVAGGLNRHEIMILASIIEAETNQAGERDLVSSVYHNRLRKEIRLQADPTVIYGLGGLKRPLFKKDLDTKTPYNTYLTKGLPPTPINSPGLEAIRAALNPAVSDYLFFVADNTGRHQFSRTNAEHNLARRKIKEERTNLN